MRALFVTAELFPWVKSGGLGDVAAALPPALIALGADVRLFLPGFPGFLDAFRGLTDVVRLRTPFASERVRVGLARLPGTERLAYLPSMTGRAAPMPLPTAKIGRTTIAASGFSAGSPLSWRAASTRVGCPMCSTVMIGIAGWRPPIWRLFRPGQFLPYTRSITSLTGEYFPDRSLRIWHCRRILSRWMGSSSSDRSRS
jgi:hypothetical protein